MPDPNGSRIRMDASDHDTLIRLTTLVEMLVDEVKGLKSQMSKNGNTATDLAVVQSQLGRLEKIVYGCAAALVLEALGILTWYLKGHQ